MDRFAQVFAYSQICLHMQTGALCGDQMGAFDWKFRASKKHLFFFFLENVLHAKDRTRVSCFTVLSVKHCFDTFSTLKSASH